MIKTSTILHLRIPFSVFLLPFFLFALANAKHPSVVDTILAGMIIHLLFYPATNGFNSYFDKDEKSIGGLKNPPPVDKELYFTSLFLDMIALVLSLLISIEFTVLLLVIGIASKLYSHPSVRLKKYPLTGLATVAFFQGAYTYIMSYIAIDHLSIQEVLQPAIIFPATLCSLILLGSYPMTQVYQHWEDNKRGDRTMSILLGVKGTFVWTLAVFSISIAGFYFYLIQFHSLYSFITLMACLLPVVIFFLYWFYKVVQNVEHADYERTMLLNKLSSLGFIIFFSLLIFQK